MLNGNQKELVKNNFKFHSKFSSCSGFTFIGLLIFISITGIVLSAAGITWMYEVRSEKEQQLLFVGVEFKNAIDSYYASTPGQPKVYPISLDDLLRDKRMPNIKRHLRKIYPDPMTGKVDWGLVKKKGRIVGIFSCSSLVPFKRGGVNTFSNSETGNNVTSKIQTTVVNGVGQFRNKGGPLVGTYLSAVEKSNNAATEVATKTKINFSVAKSYRDWIFGQSDGEKIELTR